MINKSKLILIASAILIFTAASAMAQNTRVFVADSGDDANLCTKTAQCRTITKALSVVDDGGEVIITESGSYDTFSISKSVTVAAEPGVNAGIVSSGQFAIVIGQQGTVDTVTIRNLNIRNSLNPSGTQGIYNIGGTLLFVDGCTFTGFGSGILTSGNKAGKTFVSDSSFRKNGAGFVTNPLTGEGSLIILIDSCKFEHNDYGVYLGAKTYATISNSVVSDSIFYGILISSLKTFRSEILIDNCLLTGNNTGLGLLGNGIPIARLSRSTISQNTAYGMLLGIGSALYSFQNNVISGNLTDVGGNLTPVSLK